MKIRLLSSALDDLSEGRLFYEKQGEGMGEYFFYFLFSDIDNRYGVNCSVKYFEERIPWGFIVKVDDTIFYNPHVSIIASPEIPIFKLDGRKGFGKIISNEIEVLIDL